MDEKIKRCPICGREPIIFTEPHVIRVYCNKCKDNSLFVERIFGFYDGAYYGPFDYILTKTIEDWNKKASKNIKVNNHR